jgi:hypothetical protein
MVELEDSRRFHAVIKREGQIWYLECYIHESEDDIPTRTEQINPAASPLPNPTEAEARRQAEFWARDAGFNSSDIEWEVEENPA